MSNMASLMPRRVVLKPYLEAKIGFIFETRIPAMGENAATAASGFKRQSDKRLQLEKSRRASLTDDDDMMFRLGYGGLMDDDDLSGDEEARERKRQRAFGMEEEDDEQNILARFRTKVPRMRITKGSLRCRWTLLKKKRRSLNPRFNRKEQDQREERLLLDLRAANACTSEQNVRKSRAREPTCDYL